MKIHGWILRGATAGAVLCAALADARAQVPGAPVLQNAFVNPGLAFAANLGSGGGDGSGRSYFGAAAGWGLRNGKLQLSAGAGAQRSGGSTRGAYGGRLAANVWSSRGGSLGAAAFAGFGGAPGTRLNGVVTNPAAMIVPVGASVGYKRAMGTTRGLSVYASPFYSWTRTDSGSVTSGGAFRISTGLDFAISQAIGITVGGEFGSRGGSGGSLIGGAVTFVPGRR